MKNRLSACLIFMVASSGSSMVLNPMVSIRNHQHSAPFEFQFCSLASNGVCVMSFLIMASNPPSVNAITWPAIDSASVMNHAGFLSAFFDTILASRDQLVAAGIARGVSISVCFPLDTIKTRIQIRNRKTNSRWTIHGLFQGIGGSLVGQIPYGILTFGSYEVYKRTFIEWFPDTNTVLIYVLAAVMGDITGSGWLCPSEVVKQQVQANIYVDTISAIKGIYKNKGISGFYQGYTSAITRDVPFRAIQLTTFELAKSVYFSYSMKEMTNLDPLEAAICGAFAGSIAAAITNPLDRTKSLIMTDSDGKYNSNVIECLQKIYNNEGIAGLFIGIFPRVAYITPSTTVFFIVYEEIQKMLTYAHL